MKLGEILIQLGQITSGQLDQALQAQALAGGRLGTHLVELGFIGTDQLSQALSRQLGVPAALENHFSHADPSIVAKLKANLAMRYLAVPLGIARNGSKQIVAAMACPLDAPTLDELSFALGARVLPMVAAEIAIAHNIKRLYGAEVVIKTGRSPATPAPVPTPKPAKEAPARHTPTAAVSPRPTTDSARAPASAQEKWLAPDSPPPVPNLVLNLKTMSHPRLKASATVSLEEALHRLAQAGSREQLAPILVDFMKGRFGCGMIFLVRDGQASVWRGFARNILDAAIETIAFPLAMPSCFRIATDRQAPFRGPPPAEGGRLQRQIWKYLHCQDPCEVVVVPILVKNRVLNLVYAHAQDLGRLDDAAVTDLQALCAAASTAYVRLIQKLKETNPAPSAHAH